jgi:hypothetical protein
MAGRDPSPGDAADAIGCTARPPPLLQGGPEGRWLGIEVFDADGRQVGKSLPIDKQEHIGQYFDDLAAKAYEVAAAKGTKPLLR